MSDDVFIVKLGKDGEETDRYVLIRGSTFVTSKYLRAPGDREFVLAEAHRGDRWKFDVQEESVTLTPEIRKSWFSVNGALKSSKFRLSDGNLIQLRSATFRCVFPASWRPQQQQHQQHQQQKRDVRESWTAVKPGKRRSTADPPASTSSSSSTTPVLARQASDDHDACDHALEHPVTYFVGNGCASNVYDGPTVLLEDTPEDDERSWKVRVESDGVWVSPCEGPSTVVEVNGNVHEASVRLKDGSTVCMGSYSFVFRAAKAMPVQPDESVVAPVEQKVVEQQQQEKEQPSSRRRSQRISLSSRSSPAVAEEELPAAVPTVQSSRQRKKMKVEKAEEQQQSSSQRRSQRISRSSRSSPAVAEEEPPAASKSSRVREKSRCKVEVQEEEVVTSRPSASSATKRSKSSAKTKGKKAKIAVKEVDADDDEESPSKRRKRLIKLGLDPEKNWEERVVKCSFNKIVNKYNMEYDKKKKINSNDVTKEVNALARKISRISIEASYFLEFTMRSRPDFLQYLATATEQPPFRFFFQFLLEGFQPEAKTFVPPGIVEAFQEYRKIREYELKAEDLVYANSKVKYALQELTNEYVRNMKTNVTTHLPDHVKKLFRSDSEADRREKMLHIFEYNSQSNETLKELVGSDDLDFSNLKFRWWRFLPFLSRLQDHVRAKRAKDKFNVIPIYSHGVHHLHFTCSAVHELWSNLQQPRLKEVAAATGKKRVAMKPLREQVGWVLKRDDEFKQDPLTKKSWANIFDMAAVEKLLKGRGHFAYVISTNTVDASVHYMVEVDPEKRDEQQKQQQQQRVADKFDEYIGIDLGDRLTVGAYEVTGRLRTEDDKNGGHGVKVSSRHFKYLRKSHESNFKQKNLTRHLEKWRAMEQKTNFPGVSLYDVTKYRAVTHLRLRLFCNYQPVYEQRSMIRLKFERYMWRKRAIDLVVNSLIYRGRPKKDRSTLRKFIVVGNAGTNKYAKGYEKTPLGPITKRLIEVARETEGRIVVRTVDEYRSTKLCSRCNYYIRVSRRSKNKSDEWHNHRFVTCKPLPSQEGQGRGNCGYWANRDVHAGKNILFLGMIRFGMRRQNFIPHYAHFDRSTRRDDIRNPATSR